MADKKKAPEKKEKKSYSVSSMYKDGKNENKSCPKCGPGVFMGKHKDRLTCGRCSYTERI